jgi:hypothetical protein
MTQKKDGKTPPKKTRPSRINSQYVICRYVRETFLSARSDDATSFDASPNEIAIPASQPPDPTKTSQQPPTDRAA